MIIMLMQKRDILDNVLIVIAGRDEKRFFMDEFRLESIKKGYFFL